MLQHTSSEVIIIQLQINLNSKNNNCTDWELTKLIDIKRQEYANNRDEVSHCQRFHLTGFRSRINKDSLIFQCMSDRPVANISKRSHLILWLVEKTWSAIALTTDCHDLQLASEFHIFFNLIYPLRKNISFPKCPKIIQKFTQNRQTVVNKISIEI